MTDIKEIKAVSKASSGDKAYYDIVVLRNDGKKLTAGKRIPGRRLADAVIRQIAESMVSEK